MTNLDKFIEVMNDTFDANFTPENMKLKCSPCGELKKDEFACIQYNCPDCERWWRKEYKKPIESYKYFIVFSVFCDDKQFDGNGIYNVPEKLDSYENLLELEKYLQVTNEFSELPIITYFKEL